MNDSWSLRAIGAAEAWRVTRGNPDIIVAVLDTGVDYTHKDLRSHLWSNPKEIADNQIDDDDNGYVDDVIGWDFVSGDNLPFDLSVTPLQLLFNGGNPGHGTADSGTVAALAPQVKIMSLRLLSEKGQGRTDDAVRAIHYAVDNGAKILSAAWGCQDGENNPALSEAIAYAQERGVLVITPAGKGHGEGGVDEDADEKALSPARIAEENVLRVAAVNEQQQLTSFSNWGAQSVHLAAPGTDILCLMPGDQASATVVDLFNINATWDGTAMAAAHVAGAASLYWSAHLEKSAREVKAAVLGSVKKVDGLKDKTLSGGILDMKALLGR
jgi:subtilisin family serine protease